MGELGRGMPAWERKGAASLQGHVVFFDVADVLRMRVCAAIAR